MQRSVSAADGRRAALRAKAAGCGSGGATVRRAAFTLLELVLALAVIAAVIGLAFPVLLRFSGEQALRQNVETVRARLARTRLSAMNSGLSYQFRYEPNGRRCLVLPSERPLESGAETADRGATAPTPALELELGDGLQFRSSPPGPVALTQQSVTVERLPEDWLAEFGVPTTLAQVGWAPAIQFAPDGTAQDASLVVVDADGRYQMLTVRGLTASVSVGPVERERRR